MTLNIHLDPKANLVVLELGGQHVSLTPDQTMMLSNSLFAARVKLDELRKIHETQERQIVSATL